MYKIQPTFDPSKPASALPQLAAAHAAIPPYPQHIFIP